MTDEELPPLLWHDAEAIAQALYHLDPGQDPMSLGLAELRDRVLALPGFAGRRGQAGERVLEAIQTAWYEQVQRGGE